MEKSFETERLLLREMRTTDDAGMFELDSNPNVHRYLGNNPVKNIEESRAYIAILQQQYKETGIRRWAVILKSTGAFVGWAGLKLEKHPVDGQPYYDIGYRFIEAYWGKGYGSEVATAFLDYGFNVLKLPVINAYADADNAGSRKILEKSGLRLLHSFELDGLPTVWYEIKATDFLGQNTQ